MPAETMSRSAFHGHIAARIDRLPLTRVQWQSRNSGGDHLGFHHLRY